jgi:hypothetical protein
VETLLYFFSPHAAYPPTLPAGNGKQSAEVQ